MKKTAFLFAGQGSQQTGMGERFYESFPEFRDVIDGIHLDFNLKEACFDNPDNMLKKTRYTQPCLVAFACGVTDIMTNKGVVPDYVCGLSLGEYSALYAAGVWNLEDTMRIVSSRGRAMEHASEGVDSAMVAITGMGLEEIEECCARASQEGLVSVCNLNCPGQIVIGGERRAVSAAARQAKAQGARRCVPLPVSGPFHTAFMEPAAETLKELFRTITFEPPKAVVAFNVLGGPNIGGEPIDRLLVRQVKCTVRMQSCIEYLFNQEVDLFVEIGPGTTLQGFVKKTADYLRIDGDKYRVLSINNPEDISAVLDIIS